MKIIAGNFKSNKTRNETISYLNKLDSTLKPHDSTKIYIFPSISSMISNDFTHITLGTQNAHFAKSGAFTGEITLTHLEEFCIKTILLGHSERRNLFNESDEIVAKKFDFFAGENFEIFFCIGENLAIRKADKTKDFLKNQLDKINLNYQHLILAYEPIWAIGTGENASLEQIKEVYDFLKTLCKKPVIYGGSVNENNAKEILEITDGVLVGNASLEVEKFHQIIRSKI